MVMSRWSRRSCRLTVVHDGFEPGSAVLSGISEGWPLLISSLKSLLETSARSSPSAVSSKAGSQGRAKLWVAELKTGLQQRARHAPAVRSAPAPGRTGAEPTRRAASASGSAARAAGAAPAATRSSARRWSPGSGWSRARRPPACRSAGRPGRSTGSRLTCSQLTHCLPVPIRPPRPNLTSAVSRFIAGDRASRTTAVRKVTILAARALAAASSQGRATPGIWGGPAGRPGAFVEHGVAGIAVDGQRAHLDPDSRPHIELVDRLDQRHGGLNPRSGEQIHVGWRRRTIDQRAGQVDHRCPGQFGTPVTDGPAVPLDLPDRRTGLRPAGQHHEVITSAR